MKQLAFVLLVCTFVLYNVQISRTCKVCNTESIRNNSNSPAPNDTNTMSSKPVAIAMSIKNALTFQLNTIYHHQQQRKRPTTSTSAAPPTTTTIGTVPPTVITTGTTVISSTTAAGTTTTDRITTDNNTITTVTSCDDVIQLFTYGNKLAVLSLEDKRSAVLGLTSYCVSSPENRPLPAMVVLNLVRMFAYTPQLFPEVYGPELDDVLTVVTSDPCGGLFVTEQNVRERFVEGVLSLSAGVLYRVPRPAFAAVLDTAARLTASSRPCTLPRPTVENLVTALSLSTTLFHCLSPAALEWVLRVTVDHADLWARLPTSTTAAFVDGLLRAAAADHYASESDRGRASSLSAAVLDRAMTVRLLGVLPAGHFDLLLDTDALPVTVLEHVFEALTKAPVLLNRVNPDYLARALLTVTSNQSSDLITKNVIIHLLHAMNEYSPKGMDRLPYAWRAMWSY